jgi:hypothetical protein
MVKPLAYDGSASEQTIKCGFTPRTVRVYNMTDGSEVYTSDHLQVHPTVASRGGRKTNGADGVVSWLAAAAGITIVDGGFTVGTDSACNAADTQYHAIVTN